MPRIGILVAYQRTSRKSAGHFGESSAAIRFCRLNRKSVCRCFREGTQEKTNQVGNIAVYFMRIERRQSVAKKLHK